MTDGAKANLIIARPRLLAAVGILLIAIAAGLLQLLPSVFLERSVERAGGEFLLTQITHHGDAAIFYLPAAREILDGHFPPLELHDPEGRRSLFLRPPGPTLIFAGLLAVASENRAYMAAGFIFTVAMFLAFYYLGRVWFASAAGALFFAAVGVLTPLATLLPRAFFSPQLFTDIVVKNFVPSVRTPILQLFLARIEDPLLTLWLYIIVLAFLFRFFRKPSIRGGIALGVSTGFLLYFYLYYWMFAMILLGILFILAIPRIRKGEEALRPWLAAAAVIAVLALPYVANFIAFQRLPQAAEQAARVGFETGWGIRLSVWRDYLAYAAFAIVAYVLFRRRDRKALAFVFAALASMVALWNLQLFIGWNLPPDHWPKAFALPLFAIFGLLIAEAAKRARPLLVRAGLGHALGASLLILALLLVAKKVVNATYFRSPAPQWIADYSFPKPLIDSWRWLDVSAPEAVVISNSFLTSIYLTGYTSANPYLPFGSNTLLFLHEIEERFLTVHKLFGTSPEQIRNLLVYRRDPMTACSRPCSLHTALNLAKAPTYIFTQTFNRAPTVFDGLTKNSDYTVPDWKIEELVSRYRAASPRWEDFAGGYVFVGPWERELSPRINLRANPALELVYDRESVEIYRVRK